MSFVISTLFFIAYTIYIYMGFTVLEGRHKSNANVKFFFICMALAIWSIGFALMHSAPNEEIAEFWSRASSIGWSTFYTLMLHFIMSVTGYDRKLKMDTPKLILLYMPATVFLLIYTIIPWTSHLSFGMIYGTYGWINRAMMNPWDFAFYAYYLVYLLATMVFLVLWTRDKVNRQIGLKIFGILVLMTAIGSITDVVLSTIMGVSLIRLSPIIGVLPLMVILIFLKEHGAINYSESITSSPIFDANVNKMILNFLSITLTSGGIFNYFTDDLLMDNSPWVSVLLFGLALSLQVAKNLKIRDHIKGIIIIFVIYFLIPASALYTLDFASVTTWTGPFIVVLLFAIFNSRKIILFLVSSILVGQLISWSYRPQVTIEITSWHHNMRLGMLVFMITFSILINNMYMKHISERNHRLKIQELINAIASDFVPLSVSNYGSIIHNTLRRLGEFYDLDRTYLVKMDYALDQLKYTYEWTRMDNLKEGPSFEGLKLDKTVEWFETLKDDHIISTDDIETLEPGLATVKKILEARSVQSVAAIPIWGRESLLGFIGLESVEGKRSWDPETMRGIKIISNLMADGVTKVEAEMTQNRLAFYDQLTGIPNRTLFSRFIHKAIRKDQSFAIYFLDLDGFKIINDTKGHELGDALLRFVSKRLSDVLMPDEKLARFGGDEFLILKDQALSFEAVAETAHRIVHIFDDSFMIDDQEFNVTASIGIAAYPEDGLSESELIKNADLAMYEAKARGKNRFAFCNETIKAQAEKEVRLANDMHSALRREEFHLVYQPQVSMVDEKIIGVEALIRWHHNQMGPQSPNEFIPIAEKTGFINVIGDWVLEQAIKDCKEWQSLNKAITVAVNISINQFRHKGFVAHIDQLLKAYDLEPNCLEIEITESVIIEEVDIVLESMNQLKQLGVRISIDDFGTGYSSLSRLKDLPIDRLKLDMQFVQGMEKGKKDQSIVKIIIDLARELNLKVVAEGVENQVHKSLLKAMACDHAQGYGYYRPMVLNELLRILKDE